MLTRVGVEVEWDWLPGWSLRHHGGRGAPRGATGCCRLLHRVRLLGLPLNTGNYPSIQHFYIMDIKLSVLKVQTGFYR